MIAASQPANNRVRREARSILGESGGRRVLICSHSISCSPRDRRKGEAPAERRENPWVRWLIEAFHPICARVYNPDPPSWGQFLIPAPTPYLPPHFFVLFSFLPPLFLFLFVFYRFLESSEPRPVLLSLLRVRTSCSVSNREEHTLTHSPLLVLNRSLVL